MRKFFLLLALCAAAALMPSAGAGPLFHSTDPLAQRDEWGLLHQSRDLNVTDFEPRRYHTRFTYYVIGRNTLIKDPAYVGALQTALRRIGLYCGEIDGIYSDEVSIGIARLQKNHSMRVTGTLTVPVRRALHLP